MTKYLKNPRYILLVVLLITIISILIDMPRLHLNYQHDFSKYSWSRFIPDWISKDKNLVIDEVIGGYSLNLFNGFFVRDLEIKKGLDISGGVSVLLNADMSEIPESERDTALESLKNVIERRVNLLGISEANVQTTKSGGNHRVLVELAGITDTTQAIDVIGQVAQLSFKKERPIEVVEDVEIDPYAFPEYEDTDLSGADLRRASIVFDQGGTSVNTNQPLIQLQFNAEGTRKFRELTEQNIGKRVAIFLDDQILIDPVVQTAITDGTAVITGGFNAEQAKFLAAQLNGGALPVPVSVAEQKSIGATLGQESVNQSIYAGLIGLALVIGFMVFYYGRLGIFAGIALVIYALVSLAVYKLVPIVLTLPGLTGFLLSIGMAVDANILIFERIKEELRAGKPLRLAMENGFGRSWDSIRDANTATLVTAFILFNPFDWSFFPTSGLVRGFALTLAIGIFISLFTGIFITRNLIRVFYRKPGNIQGWKSRIQAIRGNK